MLLYACVCVCSSRSSEANDLALQIADVVSGHTERVSINGYADVCTMCASVVLLLVHCRAYHGHLSTLLSLSTYKMKSIGPHCIMVCNVKCTCVSHYTCVHNTNARTHTHTHYTLIYTSTSHYSFVVRFPAVMKRKYLFITTIA